MTKGVEIKVKICSLAAEARIIRREEQRALASARWAKANAPSTEQSAAMYKRHHLLRLHRVHEVKNEARAALLAQAFVCGRRYADVEALPKRCVLEGGRVFPEAKWSREGVLNTFIWPRVADLLIKYTTVGADGEPKKRRERVLAAVKGWYQGADCVPPGVVAST